MQGPTVPASEEIHKAKYRGEGETFREAASRQAQALTDTPEEFHAFRNILLPMRFLPAGRVQSDIGSPRLTTAFNCFVSDTLEDSMVGIMQGATNAALTMRKGGGIGYDFSTLRPNGDVIVSLGSPASGPVSFMQIYDAVCKTVSSAGNRRGAQMGVLRVDHPDIEKFIEAKTNQDNLTQFNISVGITDKFMEAVEKDEDFELVFQGRVWQRVRARHLWEKIMRATWDWAEPGVLFIDRINERNNLFSQETIAATNPCGEQPLPPNGACLLGSFNLTKYIRLRKGRAVFDWQLFEEDIPIVHRAMDNIIDRTAYPLDPQRVEAESKRRMGLGVTGVANAGEALGHSYGGKQFLRWMRRVLRTLVNGLYRASAHVAAEKGCYPLYDATEFQHSYMHSILDEDVQALIAEHGLRNSHLTSIAPTGTISFTADNISSGIEPPYALKVDRTVQMPDGPIIMRVEDYALREWGVKGKTANECTVDEHLGVLIEASKWMDSAVSKTLNVGNDVTWEEFKDIYMKAWKGGCKGCTTFRAAGKRFSIMEEVEDEPADGGACYYDPESGKKSCE
jgi:ribonucleoside-diphosphate reductase alpha chain